MSSQMPQEEEEEEKKLEMSRSGHWGAAVAGAKALMALSRIQKLYEEKQAIVDEVMEEFGEAVSTFASEAEIQRLNARLEKAQTEADRIAELKESVDQKQAIAEKCLEKFGDAVSQCEPEEVVRRLSQDWEEAKAKAAQEEAAKLEALAKETELAKKMEKARQQAERAEEKMLKELAERGKKGSSRGSMNKTSSRRINNTGPERRPSGEKKTSGEAKRRPSQEKKATPNVVRASSSVNKEEQPTTRRASMGTNKILEATRPSKTTTVSKYVSNSPRAAYVTKAGKATSAARDSIRATCSSPVAASTSSTRQKNAIPFPLPR